MTTWIALLRGINVGGANVLKMDALTNTLTQAGFGSVRTYIQSGNLVLSSTLNRAVAVVEGISAAIERDHGFRPAMLALEARDLERVIEANPYPAAESMPSTLHCFFLEAPPDKPDLEALAGLASATEKFEIIGSVLYLHAPDGIGRSRFAKTAERILEMPATARNWRTVTKLRALATEP